MSGIGGQINWDGQPVDLLQLRHMMQIVNHRGPDGIWYEASANIGLGFALLAMKNNDAQHPQPIWLPDRSCAIVADAALYNREELLRRLGTISWWESEPSDAAIILAAYERWGEDTLRYIDGDFAFAIWDGRHDHVFAARDPFSAKPFFFYWDPRFFMFGSEPKQLLTLPVMNAEPDDVVIGAMLLQKPVDLENTFFKGIQRLKPAHFLLASKDGVFQQEWWMPDPRKEIWYDDPQAYYDQFRELLKASVARRLNTDFAVLAQLSGGFDSPSIVVMADEYYRQNSRPLPPFETISYVFPRMSCDETAYIKTVLDSVSFNSNGVNALSKQFSIDQYVEDTWCNDAPFFSNFISLSDLSATIMPRSGARIQLNGAGGDELALLNYRLIDLVRHGRFRTLAQLAKEYPGDLKSVLKWQILDGVTAAVPDSAKKLYRRLRKTRVYKLPDWLTPEYARYIRQHFPEQPLSTRTFRSQGQNMIWYDLHNSLFHWSIERNENHSSWSGYETRRPYCDQPLVEFVLAMPIEKRLDGELWRYLQRRGLDRQLPQLISQRKTKTDFYPYFWKQFARAVTQLEPFLFSSTWYSEPYISRDIARRLFKTFSLPDSYANRELFFALHYIVGLETWLRGLNRYCLNEHPAN